MEQLSIEHPDEITGQADTLFRRAKEAIENAKRLDGLGGRPSEGGNGHAPQRATEGRNGGAGHRGNAGPAPRATEKQLRLIHQLARQRKMERDDLEALCREAVGCASDELSKFDASRVITAMKGEGAGS